MKVIYKFLCIASIAMLVGCTASNQGSEEMTTEPKSEGEIKDELYQEVIEIHDEAMIKMESVMNLKALAIRKTDSLRSLEDESLNENIQRFEELQITLEEANRSMMIWMRQFRPVSDTTSYDQAMEYLRSEQDKISKVNDRMDQVIKEAEVLK